jgi:hypothetical protein
MGYATILGLDLGKFKSVCCAMDAATGRYAFETLASTPATLHDLLMRHAAAANGEEILLVIETCDAAGWVHDLACATAGVAVTVVHTQGDERAGSGARSSARPTATTRSSWRGSPAWASCRSRPCTCLHRSGGSGAV